MPLASSAFLRRVAAMSSYYNARGSPRPRRGYSARPPPPPPGVGPEVVSGDSHLSAVRAANDSLRRGDSARPLPPPYRHAPQPQPQPQPPQYGYGYGYSYSYGQRQQPGPSYGFVPYGYGHPPPLPQYGYGTPTPNQYGHGQPLPYGDVAPNVGFPPQNAGFRPGAPQMPPRLAEYRRRWRVAQRRPPREAERFKVLSYNILADYLAQEHQFLYETIPSFILDWKWRKDKLVFEFGLWSPDILCLQEVDKISDLEQEMTIRGYNGIWKMRTGNAVDGCAIFWRTTRFQLRYEEDIEFNKLGLRDNVAQLCVLESVVPRNVQSEPINLSTSPIHPQQPKQVVVCNIHVLYNPKRGDVKLGQVRTLLDRAYTISKLWSYAPVILCGDFNSTPKSPLYNFILEQKLDLSGLARNTISGQQTSSAQGLYTGPNRPRFRPPFHMVNIKEGSTTPLNDFKPQTEATNLVRSSSLAVEEHVLTDYVSESNKSFGSKTLNSGSTNLVGQVLVRSLLGPANGASSTDAEAYPHTTEGDDGTVAENPIKRCVGGMKVESGELDKIGLLSTPTAVNNEILQSDSSETVASSHMLMAYQSSGLKDSIEKLVGGSKNDSFANGDLADDVTSEAVTFEGNGVQSDTILDVSKRSLDEKENANEFMSGQNNRTGCEPEPSHINGSGKFAGTLHQMSTISLEEESNSGVNEPGHITSAVEPMHQSNSDISDACGDQCTPEVRSNSDSYSCPDELGSHAHAFEDGTTANEVLCSDLNSDPSFFKEFSGDNESLLEYEDRWPTTSDVSPPAQQAVTSNESYHYYDPFRWTSDELKTATGNEECTCVEHNLKVRSVYTDVEDFEGTKDGNKEPLVTSYNRKFMGTVDYIWASDGLQTVQVLDTIPKEILKQTIGFPTKKWGSDHIALVCELAFTK